VLCYSTSTLNSMYVLCCYFERLVDIHHCLCELTLSFNRFSVVDSSIGSLEKLVFLDLRFDIITCVFVNIADVLSITDVFDIITDVFDNVTDVFVR